MNTRQDLEVNSGEPKSLTECEIREALSEYVNSKWCYKSEAAEKMEIQNRGTTNVYLHRIYTSEAVIETRTMSWKNVPYVRNMTIDGPDNGAVVSIWDVCAHPPDGKKKVCYEMPHTAFTVKCCKCMQTGIVQCRTCKTMGVNACTRCDGIGSKSRSGYGSTQIGNCNHNDSTEKCIWCDGRGRIQCGDCKGNGRVQCPDCEGSGLIKRFQELQVSWENSCQASVIKDGPCNLPDSKLEKVTGETSMYLMTGCDPQDNPLSQFPDAEVRAASLKTFANYNRMVLVNNKRVLTIQQTIVTVLVTEVTGIWEGKSHQFYVFGNERKVYFPRGYPQSPCKRLMNGMCMYIFPWCKF